MDNIAMEKQEAKQEKGAAAAIQCNTAVNVSGTGTTIHGNQVINFNQPIAGNMTMKKSADEFLENLTRSLKQAYGALTVRGLPWLDHVDVSLGRYFVELVMTTDYDQQCSRIMKLEEMFTDSMEAMKQDRSYSSSSTDSTGEIIRKLTRTLTTLTTKTTISSSSMDSTGEMMDQEMFTDSNDKFDPKNNILIEAGPGYGKTTLGLKLLYDWGKGKDYLKHFNLALSVPLRNYKGNLQDGLLTASQLKKEDEEDASLLEQVLSDTKYQVLLILDGWDELSADSEEKLIPLLTKREFGHFQLIVTSRPGKIFLGRNVQFASTCKEKRIDLKELFKKCVCIKGISKKNRKSFLKCVLPGAEYDATVSLITHTIDRKMLKCPLLLLMLVVIYTDTETTHPKKVRTKTELYKEIHDYIFRRYQSKLDVNETEESKPVVTLFKDSYILEADTEFTALFSKLGEIALEGLKNDKLSFSEKELDGENDQASIVSSMGICIGSCSKATIFSKPVTTYEPIHKSFFEFWAAIYLFKCFKKSRSSFFELILSISALRPKRGNESGLLFPFLAGLMGTEAHFLFHALEPVAVEISQCFHSIMPALLNECNSKKVIFDIPKPFYPYSWEVDNFTHVKATFEGGLGLLMEEALKSGRTKVVIWYFGIPWKMMQLHKLKVEQIELHLSNACHKSIALELTSNNVQIECQTLFCRVSIKSTTAVWEDFKACIQFFRYDNIQFYFFNFFFQLELVILDDLGSGVFNMPICNLEISIHSRGANRMFDSITHLLRQNIIETLKLNIDLYLYDSDSSAKMQNTFQNFLEAAKITECLKAINLYLYGGRKIRIVLDIAKLCDESSKSWNSLELRGIDVVCSAKKIVPQCIKIGHFEYKACTFTDSAIEYLQSATITTFRLP